MLWMMLIMLLPSLEISDLMNEWERYLDLHCIDFAAEVTCEEFSTDNDAQLIYATTQEICRNKDLWSIVYERRSGVEDFKFGRQLSASVDQLGQGYHTFATKEDGLEKSKTRWSGFMARHENCDELISRDLGDVGYAIGFYDRTSLKSVIDLVSKSKNISLREVDGRKEISGHFQSDKFRLIFENHPCPVDLEFEYTRILKKDPVRINASLTNVIWQQNEDLPESFSIRITHLAKGEVSTKMGRVKLTPLPKRAIPSDKLVFALPPKNGTKVQCVDLPAACEFQDGRIVALEPPRSNVQFSTYTKGVWASAVAFFSIVTALALVTRKLMKQR